MLEQFVSGVRPTLKLNIFMMKKPKYEIGQKVWYIIGGQTEIEGKTVPKVAQVASNEIAGFYIYEDRGGRQDKYTTIKYCLDNPYYKQSLSHWIEEQNLFESKEALRDHIFAEDNI